MKTSTLWLLHERGVHSVTALISANSGLVQWHMTAVYGPQDDNSKLFFLAELRWMRQVVSDKWLIIGDFNLILQAADKNNNKFNRRYVVQDLELKELNLHRRKYTWSNDRTHTRIDRAFCSVGWDLMMPSVFLQALSSNVSDHCPLLIVGNEAVRRFTGFRFEAYWPKLQGYQNTVSAAWSRNLTLLNPFLRLHTKLQRTSKALRLWARNLLGKNKILIQAASKLIGILDVVQEYRLLSAK